VRFRAGSGQIVRCELHHVRFMHLHSDGKEEVWRLVGVCELGDQIWVGTGNVNLDEHPPIPEAPTGIVNPTHQIEELGNIATICFENPQRADDRRKIGVTGDEPITQTSCSTDTIEGVSADKVQDRPAKSEEKTAMTVAWHKCEVQVLDARRKQILKSDVAAYDEFADMMAESQSTHRFLQYLMAKVLKSLRTLQDLKAKLGCTVRCSLSFETCIFVTDRVLRAEGSPECFERLISKKSKLASSAQKQAKGTSSGSRRSGSSSSIGLSL